MNFREIIKQSCYGDNKISSKRVLMYIFSITIVMMIGIEAIYNLLLIWRCINNAQNIIDCDFSMVFDATIYGYLFGTIAALAGINGFSKQATEKIANNDEQGKDGK